MRAVTTLTFMFALACTACGGGGGGSSSPGTVTSGGGTSTPPPATTPPVTITAPVIATQPSSQSVAAGTPVTFSVAASGATLSYQWLRDGTPVAGATSSSYTLATTTLEDRGSKWRVQVTNPGGTVSSDEAVLTVSGIRLLAGAPSSYGTSDGDGAQARFHEPFGVAVDASGNVFAADFYNQTIRKISPAGEVSTYAGAAELYGRVDGTLNNARFTYPTGIAFDKAGNLYVADSAFRLIRKITPQGAVSTLTQLPKGTSVDGQSSGMFQPSGIALDSSDNIYVTNGVGTRRIAPDMSYSIIEGFDTRDEVATSIVPTIRGVAVDPNNNVYVSSLQGDVRKLGSPGAVIAGTSGVQGYMATDRHGNVYVADYANSVVRKITPAGVVSIIAGNGTRGLELGANLSAPLPSPRGIAVDANGILYVAVGHAIVKIYQP
ncbi:MAG TPA: hypothetical protein VFT37_06990 [Telluria sp.]|nr:hypothetical protein [Telluria sp.]